MNVKEESNQVKREEKKQTDPEENAIAKVASNRGN